MSNTPQDPHAANYGQEAAGFAATNAYGSDTGNKFGTAAYNPHDYGGPQQEPTKFAALKTMTLLSGLLYLVANLISMLPFLGSGTVDVIVESVETAGMSPTPEDIEAFEVLADFIMIGMVTALVVIAALYLLVYLGLKNNKNWARVLGMVFAFIGLVTTLGGLLGTVGTLGSAAGMIGLALSLAWAAVTVYWLVLAFNGEVVEYLESFRR